MPRTRVKICGITRREDALAAVEAGADALGLVFYPASKRSINFDQGREIVADIPPFVTLVGLFVDAAPAQVEAACEALPLGMLQFHGNESAAYCAAFGRPWMKALRVAQDTDVAAEARHYPGASALLLDTYVSGSPGGTGQSFDWHKVPRASAQALVLAGGLRPHNVAEAIAVARPYAVDVSGGVEAAPGIKSRALITEFIAAVAAADERSEM